MKYIVIKVFNISQLVHDVNKKIAEGYIPQGGIIIEGYNYLQVMYKP